MSKPQMHDDPNPQDPISEKEIDDVKRDLMPLGLESAMSQLERIAPGLHDAVRQRSLEAVGALKHLRLNEQDARAVRNSVEWAALVLAEACRRSLGAVPRLPLRGKKAARRQRRNRIVTAYLANLLHWHEPTPGATPDTSFVGFTLERGEGIADHIALSYPTALRLVRCLIGGLVKGGSPEAITMWGHGESERTRPTTAARHANGPLLDNLPRGVNADTRASDGLVTEETLSIEGARLRKLGPIEAMRTLAATEPSLAKYVTQEVHRILEALASTHVCPDVLLAVGAKAKMATLIAIRSMRAAHFGLWQEMAMGTRLAQLDPSLLEDSGPKQGSSDD